MPQDLQSPISSDQNSVLPSTTVTGCLDNCSSGQVVDSNCQSTVNGLSEVKYKFFYNRLYKCLCFLETENRKLLEAIRNKVRVTGEPKRLEELLDEFAFKVARKKDTYEASLTAQATSEGQQAFMAKRWKMRYHNLLDLGQIFQKKLEQVEADGATSSKSAEQESSCQFFREALTLPWQPEGNFEEALENAIDDITCESKLDKGRRASLYEFNDFTIPISSVFIQDLLANHNRYVEQINHQNEIKCRLFHELKKTKEQRNQLKKQVMEQESEIQLMERRIEDVEEAIRRNENVHNKDTPEELTNRTTEVESDKEKLTPEREVNEEPEEMKETDKIRVEIRILEYRKRELEGMLAEEEQQRRRLSKRLQDLVETIHVSCRIRPHPDNYLQVVSDDKLLCPKSLPVNNGDKPPSISYPGSDHMRCFIFDKVLGPGSGHYEIFKKLGQPLTQCLDGSGLCVMTYGPKKSGKSFTMFGDGLVQKSSENKEVNKGIAQDAVHLLLSLVRQRACWKYTIYVSALSVNDEGVADLLEDGKCTPQKTVHKKPDKATESGESFTQNKTVELNVGSEFDNLVQMVRENQMKKSGQNSHLIIKLSIQGCQKSANDVTVRSTVLLADLASWEKRCITDETEMTPAQVTPSTEKNGPDNTPALTRRTGVNESLLALSRVFTALRKHKIPAFKDSTLTQLLKPALTGDAKCFLIVTINSDPNEFTSTLASLQFAQNAMQAITRLSTPNRLKPRPILSRCDSASK